MQMAQSMRVCGWLGAAMLAMGTSGPAWADAPWYTYAAANSTRGGIGYDSVAYTKSFSMKVCNGSTNAGDYCPAAIAFDPSILHTPGVKSATASGKVVPHIYNRANPGSAYAFADLATGKLRLSDLYGNAEARLGDTLTFNFSPGQPQLVPITVSLRIDGTFDAEQTSPLFKFSIGDTVSQLVGEGKWQPFSRSTASKAGFVRIPSPLSNASWSVFGPNQFVGTYYVNKNSPTANLLFALRIGGAKSADFTHTAALSIGLPDGVSFTSASGVFLSRAASVPEPASWATMLTGFAVAGGTLRRRRGQTVANR